MNSKMLRNGIMLLMLFSLFHQMKSLACGYQYVSDCATTLDISVDGFTSGYQASNCPYLSVFDGHDFGSVTSLSISKLQSISWESCDNFVMNARFYYRIYEQGGTPGSFTEVELTELSTIAAGAYRTRTREEYTNLDLLAGLNAGSFFIDIYYESDVDFNNDGVPDDLITKNNSGDYYQAAFTLPSGQSGILDVVLQSSAGPSCYGQSNGSASVTTTNGTSPFTYAWSNGATGASVSNLSAGVYTVTSTDVDGNTGTLNVLISQPAQLLANVSGQNETSPSANNGSATAAPTGGTPGYTFEWSNGATTATITDLDSGIYGVTVTDINGCTGTGSVVIAVSGSTPTNYCDSKGDFPWVDWITNVNLADIDHASGKSQYSDFTTESTQLNLGANYSITLDNGFSWQTYDEYWKVWIDYDRDGNFEEPDEIAFSGFLSAPPLGTPGGSTTGTVNVPATAEEGLTRMRVSIKRNGYATPCETIPFGEVEDYTIVLVNGGPVPCSITSSVTGVSCDDNGTNLDPDDDTFSFVIEVNGNGTGESWETTIGGQLYTGNYGVPEELGPFDISGGDLTFTIFDSDDPGCTFEEVVTAPAPCSTPEPCSITAIAGSPICDNNGTAADPSDDTFTFSLTVSGTNTGAGWEATINGQLQSGSYGNPVNLGPYPITGGGLNFNVIDSDDPSCSTSVSVGVPAPCSTGGTNPGYCEVQGGFPWHDWVAGVVFSDIGNVSQKTAYSDFTGLTATVAAGDTYDIELIAGFSWFTYDEHWKVWIDYNQDGVFSEPDEVAVSILEPAPPNGTLGHTVSASIEVPSTALSGATRMRVIMSRDNEPGPCGTFEFGEAEDYTVFINSSFGGNGNQNNLLIDANAGLETIDVVALVEPHEDAEHWILEKSIDGQNFSFFAEGDVNDDALLAIRQKDEAPSEGQNFYRVVITDRAGEVLSENTATENFQPLAAFELFPNPASDLSRIELSKVQGKEVRIEVATLLGQPVFQQILPEADQAFFPLPVERWKDGLYLVTVHAENLRPFTKRLIISRL